MFASLDILRSIKSKAGSVIIKHANPCGVGLGGDLLEAYEKAFATDPTSAFGGIIAFNRPLDAKLLGLILERQFVEVVIALRLLHLQLHPFDLFLERRQFIDSTSLFLPLGIEAALLFPQLR